MADLTHILWNEFPQDAQPEDLVSQNFKFYDLTRSETATRQNIDNSFVTEEEVQAAVYLCRNILQQVRNVHGSFTPNNVFRCQELERVLKGKPEDWISRSQYTRGQASDIEIPGLTNIELAQWVADNLEFDQLILECFNPANGPNAGWVHVSIVPADLGENRGKVLSYVMNPETGKYKYVNGIRKSP